MSIVAGAGIARGPQAPISPEPSPLDRALAPLAGLGEAIRAEVALSLAPVLRDLEAARGRIGMLEARVRELEPVLSAEACDHPSSDAARPAAGGEAPRDAKPTPRRDVAPAGSAARHADTATKEATGPAAVVPDPDRGIGPDGGPSAPAEAAAPKAEAADTANAEEAPARSPTRKRKRRLPTKAAVSLAVNVSPAINVSLVVNVSPAVEVRLASDVTAATDARAMTDPDPAVAPGRARPDGRGKPEGSPRQEAAPDPAAIRLPAILEAGARDLIAVGLYPDLQSLINQAVYRLLEADCPADPGG